MLSNLLLHQQNTIREAMSAIDKNARGIVLIVDEAKKLIGTVTDGDIRRAILDGVNLDEPIREILSGKHGERFPSPVVATVETSRSQRLSLMQQHRVEQLPILNEFGEVVDLTTLHDLLPDHVPNLDAVVMAGGFGKRLLPLTENTPKPMLPVGDRPLLERIIEQLRDSGIRNVSMSVHYHANQIAEHFQDGRGYGVNISYLNEDSPLGTAGGLCLVERSNNPILVINGDILTKVDFRALLAYHRQNQASITVSVRKYEMRVPFGVVESDSGGVVAVREKPQLEVFVNAGIYLMEPFVIDFITPGQPLDMPELINRVVEARLPVRAFPIWEQWLDIGAPDDYSHALNLGLSSVSQNGTET